MKDKLARLGLMLMGAVLLAAVGIAGAAEAAKVKVQPVKTDPDQDVLAEELPATDPLTDPKYADEPKVDAPGDPIDAFIKKTKQPTSWLKWGADIRMREIYQKNCITLDKNAPGNEWHWQRYRTRVWSTITPIENVEFNTRLTWEFRHFCKPKGRPQNTDFDEAIFDTFNIKLKNLGGQPLTATIGRQDIILGNGWLVLDGTPLDGSRTIFFDAARLQYDLKEYKTNIDFMYIDNAGEPGKRFKPFNDRDRLLAESDSRGVILYVTNRTLPKTEINGYFIYKHDDHVGPNQDNPTRNGDDGDIYAFGARIAGKFKDHWQYRAEFVNEVGHKNQRRLCAFGFNSQLSYLFNDAMKNELRFEYEYLSGDNPNTATDEQFDPLWGRWPQFSELYIYSYATETRIAEVTNLHRLGFGWTIKPHKKLEFLADYHLLFAPQNTLGRTRAGYSTDGHFRGQLVTAKLIYKLTDYLKGHLIGEAFFPGNYYDRTHNDPAVMLRYELVFSW